MVEEESDLKKKSSTTDFGTATVRPKSATLATVSQKCA
jgi:hypothetical protein